MPFHGLKVLDITWTDLKTFKTRDTFILYYVSNPIGAYDVIGISNKFIFRAYLCSSADINDFNNNYRSGATVVASIDDAIGNANLYDSESVRDASGNPLNTNLNSSSGFVQQASTPTADTTEKNWIFGTLLTAAPTAATVLSYTVPAGKTFYCYYHELCKATVNAVNGEPVSIAVDGVEKSRVALPGGNLNLVYYPTNLWAGYPIATSGQTITATVTPSGVGVTMWSARFLGALK